MGGSQQEREAGFVLSAGRPRLDGGHTLSAVDVPGRLARRIETGANLVLALVMAGALGFDAARAARVNGQWPYVAAFGTVVCAVALLRARSRA